MKSFLLVLIVILIYTNAFGQGGEWTSDQLTSNTVNDLAPRLDGSSIWWWQDLTTERGNVIGGHVGRVVKDGLSAPIVRGDSVSLYDWDVCDGKFAHLVSEDSPSTRSTEFYVNNTLIHQGITFQSSLDVSEGDWLSGVRVRSGVAWTWSATEGFDSQGDWVDTTYGFFREDRRIPVWSFLTGTYSPLPSDRYPVDCIGLWQGKAYYLASDFSSPGGENHYILCEDGSELSIGYFENIFAANIDGNKIVFQGNQGDRSFVYLYHLDLRFLETVVADGFSPVLRGDSLAWFRYTPDFDRLQLWVRVSGQTLPPLDITGSILFTHLSVQGNTVVWSEDRLWPHGLGGAEIYRAVWHPANTALSVWTQYE